MKRWYWFAFALSWTLYGAGDFFSWFTNRESHFWATFWYTPYNWCMLRSLRAQEWVEGGEEFPWEDQAHK